MTHEIKTIILDAGEGAVLGGGTSYGLSTIWPETIHGLAVLFTGLGTATAVFFLNRWLRKRFPENK